MLNSRRFAAQFLFLLGIVNLWALSAAAQTFRGGISGSVTDSAGAAVPNIEIKATADGTSLAHKTVSSGAGDYGFQDLPLGSYTVQVEAAGFQTLVVKGVSVNGGVILGLPLKLSVSSVNTTVEVSASALSLDTASSVQNDVIAGKSLQDLPLDSRDFKKIVGFIPGFGGYSGVLGSVNGARSNQTNWQIDGTDNNDLWANNSAINQSGIGGIAGTMIPIDAIDQFSLQTQSSAETGRNPGATANLIINPERTSSMAARTTSTATKHWRQARCSYQNANCAMRISAIRSEDRFFVTRHSSSLRSSDNSSLLRYQVWLPSLPPPTRRRQRAFSRRTTFR